MVNQLCARKIHKVNNINFSLAKIPTALLTFCVRTKLKKFTVELSAH